MARSHLPSGFRFHPTDEELLVQYLKRKAAGKFVDDWVIGEVDIYKYEPAELPGLAVLRSRDAEWFFFKPQDQKHLNGSRTNRTTKAGYWKATGKDRRITGGSCTGMKKTLIYYLGRAPHGERTDWVMHEYRLFEEVKRKVNSADSFVLCRVRRKSGLGPRNGEQYGAPVCEEEEEEEVNNAVDEAYMLPSASATSVEYRHVQERPIIATVIEDARMGMETRDVDSFLQDLLSVEEPVPDQGPEGDLLVDELLSLLNDQGDFAVTHATPTSFSEVDSNIMGNFCSLLQPADNECIMLEDMLHLVSNRLEVQPEHPSRMQAPLDNQVPYHSDDLQSVGFLELADLEEPCHDQITPESADFERLLYELDVGMGSPTSTSLVQDGLQTQQILQFSGDRGSTRGLQHLGGSGMNNELEVPLASSQGLSVLERESVHPRLISDIGAAPSGLSLDSDQEGASALSHFHVNRAQEQQHAELVNHVEIGNSLLASTSRVEAGAVYEELLGNTTLAAVTLEGENVTTGLPMGSNNTSAGSAPSPPSPSSFARVITRFLRDMDALPAIAGDGPSLELGKRRHLMKENSVLESKPGELALTHPSSLSMSGSLLNMRVKLTPSQDEKQIASTPELELQWSVSSSGVLHPDCARSCKSFANGLSLVLFWVTTSALILFCMFRGLCRSTRVAIV